MFKKFHGDIDSVDYDDLDNYDNNYDFADDDEYKKIGSIRRLFKGLIKIITNQSDRLWFRWKRKQLHGIYK